jgi:protein-S-isoprenylcysteine O-methyltransferase Ste14
MMQSVLTANFLAPYLLTPAGVMKWAWSLFWVYWLVAAFGRKKTKRHESRLSRLSYTLPLIVAFALLAWPSTHLEWLSYRFVPLSAATDWIGAAVTVAGLWLAVWARRNLGGNWSGTVTLKEGHELIRSGPYRRIRHPIYTGILLGLLGTAIGIGRMKGLVAFAILWVCFAVKARREEDFLAEEFGGQFEAHRERTGMFLPK